MAVEAVAAPTLGTGKKRASQLSRQRVRSAWLFLIPMLVVLAAVAGWPLLRTIYFGFTNASLDDPASAKWIGFSNYLQYVDYGDGTGQWFGLLADPLWWNAVLNT